MLPTAKYTIAASTAAGRRMLSGGIGGTSCRRRLELFAEEKARQDAENKANLEKIVISSFNAEGDSVDLLMNKNISTAYDCAKQISHHFARNSALCLRNDEVVGLRELLKNDCSIEFLDFVKPKNSSDVNDAYWRSCSLALGAVVQSAFRNEVIPGASVLPEVLSGSFKFDAKIKGLKNWEPTTEDLQILTKRVRSGIVEPQYNFELLRVSIRFALELFGAERISAEQNLDLNEEGIAVYRIGNFVDLSNGPVVSSTGLIGKFQVAAIEQIEEETYRFKGVSVPRVQQASSYAWNIIVNTAAGRVSVS